MLMTSCGLIRDQTDPTATSVRGVPPTLERLNIPLNREAQDAFVSDLVHDAGIRPGPISGDWKYVTEAGFYEIGRQCDQYIDALFRFNREQRAARQGLTAVGAVSATIMGLAGVAAIPIAITAAAFGLSATLFDAGVNSVLFTIEPSALRNVVLQGRKKYLDSLDMDKINTRPRMMIALQGYLSQCSPAAIEANVNNAANGSKSVANQSETDSRDAAMSAAPAATIITRRSVAGPGNIRTPTVGELARNSAPDERGVLRIQLTAAQRALGIKDDGDFGGQTREAISEFQQGANKQGPNAWPASETTGHLTPRTREQLTNLGPMPKLFKSPFERAYFTQAEAASLSDNYTKPHPGRIKIVMLRLQLTPAEGDADAVLEGNLTAIRTKLGGAVTLERFAKIPTE